MVDLITRFAERVFNAFVIYENDSGLSRFIYPSSIDCAFVNRIIEFGPGCCKEPYCCEFYVLLFTDSEGRSEYAHCLQTNENIFICFTSYLPWFDCFYRLLDNIKSKELYKGELFPTLQRFIAELGDLQPPSVEKNAISIPYFVPQMFTPDIRLLIPTSSHPYFLKAFEYYYSSLEPLQWIDIFTSMLLEKSIIFYSKSRQRLTYCIIAAVSLLYPLSWVTPIYLMLPKKLLQFLESPVPFIAGIHSCMFEEAKPYITYGTRVVDLDGHRIFVNMPDEELDIEAIPAPILDFFGVEFSDRTGFPKSSITTKSYESASWKTSKPPMQNRLALQAKPFFGIILNLIGYFRECKNAAGHVNFRQMVACQACPPLEPFLQQVYESQMVHCFLDKRLTCHIVDEFEVQARFLSEKCKERLQQNRYNQPNFGDLRWISCKRSITSNAVINNLRLRRKIGRYLLKVTKKATKASLPRSETRSSQVAGYGNTPAPSLTHCHSSTEADSGESSTHSTMDQALANLQARPYRIARPQKITRTSPSSSAVTNSLNEHSLPVEFLSSPQSVLSEEPISETPITPTIAANLLRAFHFSNNLHHRRTVPSPPPQSPFQSPRVSSSSSNYCSESFKSYNFEKGTDTFPPPPSPHDLSITNFRSVISTPAKCMPALRKKEDGVAGSGHDGSTSGESTVVSSPSVGDVKSVGGVVVDKDGVEGPNHVVFVPPVIFSRSKEGTSPPCMTYQMESAI